MRATPKSRRRSQRGKLVEMPFDAVSGVGYRIWVHMRAQNNSTSNDSIHIQFSDTVTSSTSATATMQFGSTSSAEFVLQQGSSGAAPAGWGWTDNGWGVPGDPIFFGASGSHTLRIQQREDGPTIDQIVMSPDTYLHTRPGATANDSTIVPKTGGTP